MTIEDYKIKQIRTTQTQWTIRYTCLKQYIWRNDRALLDLVLSDKKIIALKLAVNSCTSRRRWKVQRAFLRTHMYVCSSLLHLFVVLYLQFNTTFPTVCRERAADLKHGYAVVLFDTHVFTISGFTNFMVAPSLNSASRKLTTKPSPIHTGGRWLLITNEGLLQR